MNKRNACLVGLAAGATLLAGCVAQYQNPSACEQEMRSRLASASLGDFSVTHTAVAYRGKRVVIEGQLERGMIPASGVLGASEALAVGGMPNAGSPAVASAASAASSAAGVTGKQHAAVAVPASGASAVSAASAPKVEEPKPTTPLGILAVKLGLHKAPPPGAAAECQYDRTGALTAFHWLSPAALAKTTPATPASDAQAE
ncbi:hypothetical protein [Paraburkholderia sp. Ac-20340]|uniref:hypothetical protein n=1 Tax=Paraburkholderia sp. Ac-20340 TaxID=2703888 RepID=UPI0019803394|nr:hypothetical protein [Paraburkholderia sp. Ac-20340]